MADKTVFICSDGHRLAYNLWLPDTDKPIKAYIQIIHGMAEYSDRYSRFARYLNKSQIAVFAADLRGHGETASDDETGWFAENDGWNRVASDVFEIANFIKSTNPTAPVFLFGHSLGSLLARTVIVNHSDFYSGAIIMGTASSKGIVGKIGKIICKNQIRKYGSKTEGKTMFKLTFSSYNKTVKNPNTDYDWLSRDDREVEKYVHDSKCGFVCSNGLFYDMLCGIEYISDAGNASMIEKDFPMLIISGSDDPVGDMGRGVKKVYNLYKKVGIADLTLKTVQGARHELLNETDRKETTLYILKWIERHI